MAISRPDLQVSVAKTEIKNGHMAKKMAIIELRLCNQCFTSAAQVAKTDEVAKNYKEVAKKMAITEQLQSGFRRESLLVEGLLSLQGLPHSVVNP